MQCSRGSKKDFWRRCRGDLRQVKSRFDSPQRAISGAVAGEIYAKSRHTKYPSQLLSFALHYLPFASRFPLPHFTLAVLFAFFFSFASFSRLLVVMASPLSTPLSPEFEVFHFKQRQGENLKDAWLRIMESHRNCTSKINLRILLRNFYVGLNMSHRQLFDCVGKGNFIETDHHITHEVIEGIVGTLPQQKGPHPTQEETQVFEKICEVTKILQKSLEPLKNINGNIHRMNMLITLYNKRLDSLDLKFSEYEGKCKEPPGFELDSAKKLKTKDGNT